MHPAGRLPATGRVALRMLFGTASPQETIQIAAAQAAIVAPVMAGWRCYSTSSQLASNTQVYLRNLRNGGEIFLIGTAHVSKRSAEEVRDVIRMVKPDTVFVELCQERAEAIRRRASTSASPGNGDGNFIRGIAQAVAGGGPLAEQLVRAAGTVYNRYFKLFGMEMGQEFRVAMEESDRIGARVVYGDRPQQETIQGILKGINIAKILQLAMGGGNAHVDPELEKLEKLQREAKNLEEVVEALKTRGAARMMVRQMDEAFPEICRALIHERDEIMATALASEAGRVVAVVGLGHLDGIEKRWEALTSQRQPAKP